MLKNLVLLTAALALTPMVSFAETNTNYTDKEVELIEDALDDLVTPARVDVGVGIGEEPPRRGRARYVCRARSWDGRNFDAVGYSPYRVERRALMNCERRSMSCHSVGCRRVR